MTFDLSWWISFNIALALLMVIDFKCLRQKQPTPLHSLLLTGGWISIALLFTLLLFFVKGSKPSLEFITGYLIEESLSIDNLFVFLMIFRSFNVPPPLQARILMWGICSALIMRFVFIIVGITLIQQFHWLIYILGAFLIVTGALMWKKQKGEHPSQNSLVTFLKKIVPIKEGWYGDKFFIKEAGKTYATGALLVLFIIESTDLLFALDSIPAVFAITLDPFIVYSCNALAILGLRSLYFVLQDLLERLSYLHYGVCLILIFVGTKMVLSGIYPISTGLSLAFIAAVITLSLLLSRIERSS